MKTTFLLSHKNKARLFLIGLALTVSLDVIFFSNCIVPGADQPPNVLKEGEQQFGFSGHTILLIAPAEIGVYYRRGLADNTDFGLKFHNFGGYVGIMGDLRKEIFKQNEILKFAGGLYTDMDNYIGYFAPSFLFGGKFSYWGIQLNNYAFSNGYGDFVFEAPENSYHSTSYAIGPTVVAGLQTTGNLKFYGGFQAGAIFLLKSSQIWPILQIETGLGYAF